uniref:Uncharacterized protein LOC104226796 n=1 Tax=Nicotiana sylvestris TaxID=4096 RepID=A0A1U7WSG0_NICSY
MEIEGSIKAQSTGNIEESLGGGRSAFSRGSSGPSQSISQSSASAPPLGRSQQQLSRFRPNQGSRGSHQRGRSGERSQQQRSPCPRCGKMHSGICYLELPICYGSPSPARCTLVPAGRGVARGGVQSSGGPSHFYAMSARQTAKASLDVVT